MNERYLVQAILVDGDLETVTESIKTDDPIKILDWLMMRHKNSYHHQYNVLNTETQEVRSFTNRFQR